MTRSDRPGWRASLVVALLAVTFLLTAFLAMRGLAVARYHRETAAKVVRDWARVAADELVRRVEAQAGFYGTYPVLQEMAGADPLPGPAALAAAAGSGEGRRNAALVRATFRYRAAADRLDASPELTPGARAWLRRTLPALAAAPPPPSERRPLHAAVDGADRVFVYLVAPPDGRIEGFEVEREALRPFVERAVASGPLLPSSLAAGKITNDRLVLRLSLPGSRELFRSPGAFDAALGIELPIEDGLLSGGTAAASLAPATARLLVFGGVPRPAAAIYLIPLALSAALLLAAVHQLRREQALARLRSEFVASVSHELRTPLTQIRMFAETLLLERVRSDAEARRSLVVVDQEARRLAQLVDNLLQFSRGERGTLRIAPRPLDPAALVRETVEAFAPIAAARGVRIATTLPAPAPPEAPAGVAVRADDDALRQVLLNLLDNAVKYGPPGQEVTVTVEATAAGLRLAVDDEGPGIPARDRRRVFRRYERLEREAGRGLAGAGIGLAVVAELVALHGGRVRVEEGARGGARFVVELPAEGPP